MKAADNSRHKHVHLTAQRSAVVTVSDMSLIGCDIRRNVRIDDATLGVGGVSVWRTGIGL